jgi:hypothetical protein
VNQNVDASLDLRQTVDVDTGGTEGAYQAGQFPRTVFGKFYGKISRHC